MTAFISYSHLDESFTNQLRHDLATNQVQVWIDHEKLTPGTRDWDNTVREGIRNAQVVILIASPESRKSAYVRDELALAREYQRPVIPLWIAGQYFMDSVPLGWGSTQHIDARQLSNGLMLEQLVSALRVIMDARETISAPPRVFLCHSHADNSMADRLAHDLKNAGADVWYDVPSLQGGVDFIARINEALARSEWFVLLLTPDSLASPWVRRETDAALSLTFSERMRAVIPFVVRPVDSGSVPPIWQTLQRIDGTADYQAALDRLLRALGLV